MYVVCLSPLIDLAGRNHNCDMILCGSMRMTPGGGKISSPLSLCWLFRHSLRRLILRSRSMTRRSFLEKPMSLRRSILESASNLQGSPVLLTSQSLMRIVLDSVCTQSRANGYLASGLSPRITAYSLTSTVVKDTLTLRLMGFVSTLYSFMSLVTRSTDSVLI